MKASSSSPELAAPGAGLPWVELQIARLIFHAGFLCTTPAKTGTLLTTESENLTRLAQSLPAGEASRPVLIRRLPGMEDSSRNWSVFMTLEHVAIVNEVVAGVITSLNAGKIPTRKASTADVKPQPGADATAIERCRTSANKLREAAAVSARKDLRFAHPWFGPLNAAQWHFMAGFHQRLHRRQVESIMRGLPNSTNSGGR